jgi:L-malate glycosyltransferase
MHVLVIPSWYTCFRDKLRGIFFKEQAEALSRLGNRVGVIFVNQDSFNIRQRENYYKFGRYRTNNAKNYIQWIFDIPSMPKYRKINDIVKRCLWKCSIVLYIIVHGKPDVVHLQSFYEGEIAIWIKKIFKIKYIVSEHSTAFYRDILTYSQETLARRVYRLAAKRTAVSEELSTFLLRKYGVVFQYIPNFIDTTFFTPKSKNITKEIEVFRFINIASLHEKKNHSLLIDAIKIVKKQKERVELLIIGDGPEKANLIELINTNNLNDTIRLLGKKSRKEVCDYLRTSDCFVLTSTFETFGVVIIESMSCGLPVITTRSGGPESILKNEELGYLCDSNPACIAQAMIKVMNTNFDSDYIRQYVIENFSNHKVVTELNKVLRSV